MSEQKRKKKLGRQGCKERVSSVKQKYINSLFVCFLSIIELLRANFLFICEKGRCDVVTHCLKFRLFRSLSVDKTTS